MSEDNRRNPDDERLERLYRQAADAEPGGRIDEAVLGRAREAASAPRRKGLQHPGAWGVGIAAAASLVLAVGLYLDQRYNVDIDPPAAVDSDIRLDDRPMRKQESTETAREPASRAVAPVPGEGEKAVGQQAEQAAYRAVPEQSAEPEERQQPGAVERDEAQSGALPAEELEDLDAAGWLSRIQRLIDAGELDRARHELRDFRSSHPSSRVPVEIKKKLSEVPD